MISPPNVITNVEKMKAVTPAMTESESMASSTLVATLPHRMVVSRKLESCRMANRRAAFSSPRFAIMRSLNDVTPNMARFSPEKVPDCATSRTIPIHFHTVGSIDVLQLTRYQQVADRADGQDEGQVAHVR